MLQRHYHNKNGIEGFLEEKKCKTHKNTSSNVAPKIGTEKKKKNYELEWSGNIEKYRNSIADNKKLKWKKGVVLKDKNRRKKQWEKWYPQITKYLTWM